MRSLVLSALSLLAVAPMAAHAYTGVAIVQRNSVQGDGTYPDPHAALSAAGTWCPNPSESAPCLVKIMPGTYDIGTNRMSMPSFVDVEGSGESTTTIVGSGGVIVDITGSAELRQVTVAGRSETVSVAVLTGASAKAKLKHTTISVTGGLAAPQTGLSCRNDCDVRDTTIVMRGANALTGVNAYSVVSTYASPLVLDGLTVSVESTTPGTRGTGVYVRTPTRIMNSTIKAAGGGGIGVRAEQETTLERVLVEAGAFGVTTLGSSAATVTLRVDASQIVAPYTLDINSFSSAFVGASKLAGQNVPRIGPKNCIASYDADYQPLSTSCLPL